MESASKRAPYAIFEGPHRDRNCPSEKVSTSTGTVPGGSEDYGAPYGKSTSKYQNQSDANFQRLRRKLKFLEERVSIQGADLELAITEANHYKDRIARDTESHRLEVQVWKSFIAIQQCGCDVKSKYTVWLVGI